jgi:prophage regulatory protein
VIGVRKRTAHEAARAKWDCGQRSGPNGLSYCCIVDFSKRKKAGLTPRKNVVSVTAWSLPQADRGRCNGKGLRGKERMQTMSKNLIPYCDLKAKGIPYSKPHLWRLEKAGKFPKRVPLGPSRYSYVESEIDGYIDALIDARDAADPADSDADDPADPKA